MVSRDDAIEWSALLTINDDIVFAYMLNYFEDTSKFGGNHTGITRAEFTGVSLGVSDANQARDDMEKFIRTVGECDVPGTGLTVPETR